jgi:hypothetical protein
MKNSENLIIKRIIRILCISVFILIIIPGGAFAVDTRIEEVIDWKLQKAYEKMQQEKAYHERLFGPCPKGTRRWMEGLPCECPLTHRWDENGMCVPNYDEWCKERFGGHGLWNGGSCECQSGYKYLGPEASDYLQCRIEKPPENEKQGFFKWIFRLLFA